jgi:hypothetical protein
LLYGQDPEQLADPFHTELTHNETHIEHLA